MEAVDFRAAICPTRSPLRQRDTMTDTPFPCTDRRDALPRAAWGTVRTSVATTILAPRDYLVPLFLDYAEWPRIFTETIAGGPREPFVYTDKGNLATIGRAAAVAHIGRVKLWGFAAWVLWLVVHIMYLVGFRNRVVVLIDWAWAYVTMSRGARLITGDIEHERPVPAPTAMSRTG